ncbi:hypothetical protein [Pseudomonas sp. JG-B]|uniref:hypothetical protein n=1 Tax=Pseudomonas sp. JG-B TaxID=2603214 RepID=UPI00129E0E2B|nr:hypothetical protein [Pseudomonas sp. JG-B]MRK21530.1 hypothetical protein [Pseudomonas sp. JG-B]
MTPSEIDADTRMKLALAELLLVHLAGKPQLAQELMTTLQQHGQGFPVPTTTLSELILQAAQGLKTRRLGMLQGKLRVPADFDTLGQDEIERLFHRPDEAD